MPDANDAHHLDGLRPETLAVVAGRPAALPDEPLNVPVTFASTYIAGGEREYGRYANPGWSAFEEALGALEGGRVLAFASGMAASSALLDLVPQGGVVVVPRHSYLGTLSQLRHLEERGRVVVRQVDAVDTAAVIEAAAGAALVWMESPSNPALEVVDLASVIAAAKAAGALVVVDNTFATPLRQRPLELGADLVLHSATKFIAGHSDVLMGAVAVRDEALHAEVLGRRSMHGAAPGPMETFLALRGLRTLPLRLERAEQNAAELAARLDLHPAIAEVRYPGFGAIVSVVLADAAAADALVAGVRLWRQATSLGAVESTLERRRRWAGEAPTIPEGLVRLSTGVEHIEDLHADLVRSLDTLG
ncbi:trans-sulfuration enzyme family protein [Homoserinibacter sp. YIM 151385]|uniref:trans-sulfuration enzyme family protein n=1 Tax=Homoserinibacter sp. YIM 151385 TaxID=2985506 RepID=UPI0022F0BC22|nr:PLP-dependent transferase [Homoserinibacter sp. YIM 151385]WBU37617.1 PLP-dependent transferase [Homoserinibacter sp. YIM 151385]